MRIYLLAILLFLSFSSFGQQKIVGIAFLKFDGNYVSNKDSADFIRIISARDSGLALYPITEYYKDGKRKLVGTTSTIEPPFFEGQCVTFYKSGKKESLKNYKDNVLAGDEFDFFPNGKVYQHIEYPANGDRYNEFDDNYLITASYDSLGAVLVDNGNGYYKGYNSKFTFINEEGTVKDGKRDGVWKGNDRGMGITYEESYNNGVLTRGSSVDSAGIVALYTQRADAPQFKGGDAGFANYLAGHIQYPEDARKNNIQGRVILSFIVEKNGKVTEVKVSKSAEASLNAEAVRVLRSSPAWKPGTRYGRKARVVYSVPVNFALTD